MAENLEEQHPENSTNIRSENLLDENTPAKEPVTITQNQETENMEVHKHPHHITHKKNGANIC